MKQCRYRPPLPTVERIKRVYVYTPIRRGTPMFRQRRRPQTRQKLESASHADFWGNTPGTKPAPPGPEIRFTLFSRPGAQRNGGRAHKHSTRAQSGARPSVTENKTGETVQVMPLDLYVDQDNNTEEAIAAYRR